MTEHQFRSNPSFADELKTLLSNPTLKLALEIVENKAKAKVIPEQRAGVPYDTTLAHHYNRCWGIQRAVDHLKLLCEPPPLEGQQESEGDEFFDSLPPEMQQAIIKKRNEATQ